MLLSVHVVLDDGLEFDLAQEVDDDARLSPSDVLQLAARDGYVAISDSARVSVNRVVSVTFAEERAPGGPGWGPGLQDEDVAAVVSSRYSPEKKEGR